MSPTSPHVSPEAVIARTMPEHVFLERALEYVQACDFACFLDSAGPLGERSRFCYLSGLPLGLFLHRGKTVDFLGLNGEHKRYSLDAFRTWVNRFFAQRSGEGQMLFPLMTYEGWNPVALPERPHPLWRGADSVWLWCDAGWTFDREEELLSGPAFPAKDVSRPTWNFLDREAPVCKLGWRESAECYGALIKSVQVDIYEGNFYQANLSQRFLGECKLAPVEIYRRLRAQNPSPFMGIFKLRDLWVVSGSPERLVEINDARLSARPIAGTKPRFADQRRNQASIDSLLNSEKERAEHLMLLDLIRNDLGRVAAPGSVWVSEFSVLESYSHVHHMVSQVEATLAAGVGVCEVLDAVFPGGTITGAPKIAVMQRLAQLEGEARGPYTGAMGYITDRGVADFNILIRTFIQEGWRVACHGGGGIVADSRTGDEYSETRHKCQALFEAMDIDPGYQPGSHFRARPS